MTECVFVTINIDKHSKRFRVNNGSGVGLTDFEICQGLSTNAIALLIGWFVIVIMIMIHNSLTTRSRKAVVVECIFLGDRR